MKKLLIVCVLVSLMVGCSGVVMTPTYSNLLDQTATWSKTVSDQAANGQKTVEQMKQDLDTNAQLWQAFKDARDGKETTTQPSN